MVIRKAAISDLDIITAVEAECFPTAEAASKESFRSRLETFPDFFWLMFDGDKLVSFVNGMATNEPDLRDDMYDNASLHNKSGLWQMIFGVDTIPQYRKRGCAAELLNAIIEESRVYGRKGLVLTCKDKLIHYYAKFGFINEGISESVHGGAVWYQMRLTFPEA